MKHIIIPNASIENFSIAIVLTENKSYSKIISFLGFYLTQERFTKITSLSKNSFTFENLRTLGTHLDVMPNYLIFFDVIENEENIEIYYELKWKNEIIAFSILFFMILTFISFSAIEKKDLIVFCVPIFLIITFILLLIREKSKFEDFFISFILNLKYS